MRKIMCIIIILAIILTAVACSSEPTINVNDSLEVKVEKIALKAVSKEENIIKTSYTEDTINGGKIISVLLNGKDSGRITLLDKSKDILEKLFQIDEVSEVQLTWDANLVDQYGKVENMPVLKIMIKKDTAGKIGWELFDVNKFKDIADSYWTHKAYEK
jgi:hypothetical protein